MKKILTSALFGGFLTASAFAADLPSRRAPVMVPPPPLLTWQGFYVGINAGYIEGRQTQYLGAPLFSNGGAGSNLLAPIVATTVTNSLKPPQGFLGGGQIGYNWQFASFVLGLETDFDGSIARRNVQSSGTTPIPVAGAGSLFSNVTERARIDYFGTLRGRIGYLPWENVMVYVTGGLAYARIGTSFQTSFSLPGTTVADFGAAGGISSTRLGGTVGGGLEWMFLPNWSVKGEALYYDLGRQRVAGGISSITAATGAPVTTDAVFADRRLNGFIVRAGLNYHFNFAGPVPVVARY